MIACAISAVVILPIVISAESISAYLIPALSPLNFKALSTSMSAESISAYEANKRCTERSPLTLSTLTSALSMSAYEIPAESVVILFTIPCDEVRFDIVPVAEVKFVIDALSEVILDITPLSA